MRGLALLALLAGCGASAAPATTLPSAASAAQDGDLVRIGLAAASEELLASGYRALGEPELGFLAPSMRTLSRVTVPARTCLAIAAAATPSIADLDAALYADDGSVLAEDDSARPRPVLRLCSAERPLSAHLALYAFQGAGSYALQRFDKPLGAGDTPETSSGGGAASAGFLELLRSLRARGYEEEAPLIEVQLTPQAPLRIALKALAGHCYSVVADGADTQLRLLSSDGSELSLGLAQRGPSALQHCAPRDADLALELSARTQLQAVRVARLWARQRDVGGARSLWLGEPAPASFETPPVAAKAAGKPPDCGGRLLPLASELPLSQGAVWEALLPAASACALVEAELHAGLSRATLRVEDADGATLEEREITGASGSVYACTQRRPARASLIARAGFGAVSVRSRACRE